MTFRQWKQMKDDTLCGNDCITEYWSHIPKDCTADHVIN